MRKHCGRAEPGASNFVGVFTDSENFNWKNSTGLLLFTPANHGYDREVIIFPREIGKQVSPFLQFLAGTVRA